MWSVRVMVPKADRERLGRTKYVVSLKTRDKSEANQLKHGVVDKLKKKIAADLAGFASSPQSARALLELAESERRKVEQGAMSPKEAESSFEVAVDDYLEGEARRLGFDLETGHPLISEVDTRVIRAAHAVMAGEGITLLEHASDIYLGEIAATIRKQTLQEKRRHIEKLTRWLGSATDVRSVDRRRAGQYVTKVLSPEGKAPKTTKDEIGNLSAFFNWLERRGEVEANPFFRMSGSIRESTLGSTPKRRPWTNEELLKVLEGIPTDDPLWPMVAISAYSGMRREEVARMRVEDLGELSWTVKAGKSKSAVRTVPIHPVLRPLVERLAETSTDGFLIPGLLTGGADDKRGHMVGKRFTKLRHDLGIVDSTVNFHTLRNAFIQRCEEAGIELSTAKQLSGHKRTDQTYGGYSPGGSLEMLEKAIRRITFGSEVDALIREAGARVTVTKQSRRRFARSASASAL